MVYKLNGLEDAVPHPAIIEDMERQRQGIYQRVPQLPSPANSIYDRQPLEDKHIGDFIPDAWDDTDMGNNVLIIDR
jgi:hypothetical protein